MVHTVLDPPCTLCKVILFIGSIIYAFSFSAEVFAAKKISCPDGTHIEISIKEVKLDYQGASFMTTLNSLSAFGIRLSIEPKTLQTAATATQQWNEFLKGLVAGYNSCAITKKEYAEGVNQIYPRLKQDAVELKRIEELIAHEQRADEQRLKSLLDRYLGNLRRFASLSHQDLLMERITAVVEHAIDPLRKDIQGGTEQVLRGQGTMTTTILERLDSLERRSREAPLREPKVVESEIKKRLLVKGSEAEAAYNKGYEFSRQYRFSEAIPHFEQALAIVNLPDFYLGLGRALFELPDLDKAEKVLREGLNLSAQEKNQKVETALSRQLARVLLAKDDFKGALSYMARALVMDQNTFGQSHPDVATDLINMGVIHQAEGDLDGALRETERGLKIYESVYGPNAPAVETVYNNIGQILLAKGDLDGALRYAEMALKSAEACHGSNHPDVAINLSNIGQIYRVKGDWDGALRYSNRALKIMESVFGLNHPAVATVANNIGEILRAKGDLTIATVTNNREEVLRAKGDLKRAQVYVERALKIDEAIYGPNHSVVAIDLANLGKILFSQRELDSARRYLDRAVTIDEAVYGPNHPTVADGLNSIGLILHAKGDLGGALRETGRALKINESAYGPNSLAVATVANNIGQILKDKGDLDGALLYTQRAWLIYEDKLGSDNPITRQAAKHLNSLRRLERLAK